MAYILKETITEQFLFPDILILCYLICRLADLVGFGVAVATGMQYIQNFPERTYKSMLIPLMQEDKRAG